MNKNSWHLYTKPGLFLANKQIQVVAWNKQFGQDNWRLVWVNVDGQVWDFLTVFWQVVVPAYFRPLSWCLSQAMELTAKAEYLYGYTFISKQTAFNPGLLVFSPYLLENSFPVALNIILENYLGFKFGGPSPLSLCFSGQNCPNLNIWPKSSQWHPSAIPVIRPDQIQKKFDSPKSRIGWGTVADYFYHNLALQVKNPQSKL